MLDKVLRQAAEFEARARSRGSRVWYRGLRDARWALTSTLHRHVDNMLREVGATLSGEERRDLLYAEANGIFHRFTHEAAPLLRPEERTGWGTLCAMQHFSIPTRLMDWSESFLCALFFSQRNRDPKADACIWALDAEYFNYATKIVPRAAGGMVNLVEAGEDSVVPTNRWLPMYKKGDELPPLAGAPIYTNPRMTAQRSAFVVAGDSFEPLEKQFGLVADGVLERIDLPAAQYQEAEDYLRLVGITAYTYFPDLEGLAEAHRQRARWNIEDTKAMLSRTRKGP